MPRFKICNTVSTADLKQRVDIQKFNQHSWGRFDTVGNYNGKVGYVKDDSIEGKRYLEFSDVIKRKKV
jgi:hypothetical protein